MIKSILMKRLNLILWILAIIFTLSLSVYQRITGPTKPVRGKVDIKGNSIKYKLLRTEVSGINAPVSIATGDSTIKGQLIFKRYKSHDEWTTQEMAYADGILTATLPTQAPAGKVQYKVILSQNDKTFELSEEPVILRYKGDVPAAWLIPHIIFMFAGLLLSVRSLLQAFFVNKKLLVYSALTLVSLVLGGLVFGPVVQKFAFGAYWTGFPFGHDLTDNKTAVMVLFWVVALVMALLRKKHARWWIVLASIVLLATYLIPHSMMGSELDYTQIEQAEQGMH